MNVNRRNFLIFLGATAGSLASDAWSNKINSKVLAETAAPSLTETEGFGFDPVKLALPDSASQLSVEQQIASYGAYEVQDDLILPTGFTYDLIAAWGDRVGDSRFGYNNDYLSLVETAPDEGYLTVNFEYISAGVWMQTYPKVIGKQLPVAELLALANGDSKLTIDAFSLPKDDATKQKIREISTEGLIDQGLGVISVQRNAEGKWERTYSEVDRRVTGISGLNDPSRLLKSTGAAAAVFTK
ncbi:MAG: alkaline phosphatase PhoX, partial [Cyanobacteria bacterium P01_A01_bin.83]